VRSLLAIAMALTLLTNDATDLFPAVPGPGLTPPYCFGVRHLAPFCLVNTSGLEWARWFCIVALVLVASGYRPRITGLLHVWVAFGFQASSPLLDGGDQVTAVLALLLLPVTLTDPRRWHWDPPPIQRAPAAQVVTRVALGLARLQVAGIYFHAAVGKATVEDWANGTALYYWTRHPLVGATGWSASLLAPLTLNAVSLSLLTWGVVALEFALAGGLIAGPRLRRALLAAGVLLHLGILVIHGLVSFSLVMIAALVLYLHPVHQPFAWPAFLERLARRPRGGAAPGVSPAPAADPDRWLPEHPPGQRPRPSCP
jgi:antimicrobial peptide system SdpB family protein